MHAWGSGERDRALNRRHSISQADPVEYSALDYLRPVCCTMNYRVTAIALDCRPSQSDSRSLSPPSKGRPHTAVRFLTGETERETPTYAKTPARSKGPQTGFENFLNKSLVQILIMPYSYPRSL